MDDVVRRRTAGQGRDQDIFQHRTLRQQMVKLEDKADQAVADGGQLGIVQAGQRSTVDTDGALVGGVQGADAVEQRAFAAAGGADNGDALAFVHGQADAPQDLLDRAFGRGIPFADILRFDQHGCPRFRVGFRASFGRVYDTRTVFRRQQ